MGTNRAWRAWRHMFQEDRGARGHKEGSRQAGANAQGCKGPGKVLAGPERRELTSQRTELSLPPQSDEQQLNCGKQGSSKN